ncbi:PEPxxWA-CTERM sorting domain-containing protein [Sphingomonas azotifigens]|uniref:PEPxxWA-CTERM sorting domain-containing protein n=1 Tax=Sphingomonas azotifigens TaxID=330920 RepID=UPI000A0387A8|nr:PEPxxWA-CTERM sorting domain-containing protein [Sphingomonas azotifigens]
MTKFKYLMTAAVAAGAFTMVGSAQAASIVCKSTPAKPKAPVESCSFDGTAGNFGSTPVAAGTVAKPGTASTVFQILLPQAGTFYISLTPGGPGIGFNKLTFGSATEINPPAGHLFDFTVKKGGWYDIGVWAKNTAKSPATFSSSFSFDAVPEPATWGMMIAGVGMAGASLRRRRSVRVAVA